MPPSYLASFRPVRQDGVIAVIGHVSPITICRRGEVSKDAGQTHLDPERRAMILASQAPVEGR
jgi:hypothetical protein